jgi:feruloyl esterase
MYSATHDWGVAERPRFDPEQLLCKSGQDAASCLTAAQVKAVKMIYGGMVDPRTKQRLWPGLMPGSEAPGGGSWESTGINGPAPFQPVAQFYSLAVFENPNADFRTINPASAAEQAAKKFSYINHTSTNLDGFLRRGGKLLLYHGWADPLISPANTINYYGAVIAAIQQRSHSDNASALQEVEKSARLFMVPGMGHCGGGPGSDKFDGIGALDRWVDQGVAPEKIVASHVTDNATTFSRPLCPFPQVAEYSGSGDRKDASAWACKARPFTYDASFYAKLPRP